ncbi:MAG TPA: ABC transporter permease [Thermoanaerobaculia bacterium]|nr:ABC transporter permease [Thermoanaerobaculia bacterium]
MDHLFQDLRYALRQLGRAPGFTAVAILTLGLGIGATTTLFSVVHGVLLRALPYPEPDRIVRVFEVGKDGTRPAQMSDPNFSDLSEQNRSFEGLAQFQTMLVSVSGGNEPARVMSAQVSREFFRVIGVQPLLGRIFHAGEQREGAAPVALVSYGYWQRYLEGDRDLSGRTLTYGDDVVSVIGVMPPEFGFPEGADLWIPRERERMNLSRTALNKKVIGRLAAHVPIERAREDLKGIARRLKAQYGDDTWMTDAEVIPLHEELVGRTRPALLLLLGASGLLLLIACANVVNLLLARAASRQRELAVRLALGAGRARLTQQFLTESLLLALLGGALGVLVARWGVDLLRGLKAGNLPRLDEIRVDGGVLLFALAVSVVVAVGLALLASWRATGDGMRAVAMGQRTQAGTGTGTTRLREVLVVSQVALTLMLLVGSGLLLRSFQRLLVVEPGYRTEGAVVLNGNLPYAETDEQAEHQKRFHERLITRLGALPGVAEVGGVDALPLKRQGANGTFLLLNRPDEVTDWDSFGAVVKIPERTGYAEYRRATPGYFRAMEIPLLGGRLFDERDHPEAPHVAVVSQSLAEATWPGEDPIGKLIQFGNMDGDLRAFTVVGVVGDIRDASLEADPQPTFYANALQRPRALSGSFNILLVARNDPASLMTTARRIVHELDPQAAPSLETLDEVFAGSLAERRFQLLLLGFFAVTALLLAVVGIYGVISFHVVQRTQEIGVRVALGATSENVVRLVMQQALLLAALGVALGLAGALAVTRLMQSLLYGITTTDPVTFLAVPVLLAVAAVLACFLPASRAARVNPLIALRAD